MSKINVEFSENGYPYWVRLESNGTLISLHHDDLPDLIFQLQKVAYKIKKKEEIRHQMDLGRAFRGE